MAISKYVFRLVGHGSDITEDSVTAVLEDLKTVVKPYKDIVDIDINENEATILLYSDSKIKKNQKMGTELTMAVVFKHVDNFAFMYKEIDDVHAGKTIFHEPRKIPELKESSREYTPPRMESIQHVRQQVELHRVNKPIREDTPVLKEPLKIVKQQVEETRVNKQTRKLPLKFVRQQAEVGR